jgi:hypothetical protein
MSIEEEKFDDLFKSKLSETDFEFSEANWDKAEALIILANKKRKRRRIGIVFFIGLILGISIMIPFIGDEKKIVLTEKKESVGENEKRAKEIERTKKPTVQKAGKQSTQYINSESEAVSEDEISTSQVDLKGRRETVTDKKEGNTSNLQDKINTIHKTSLIGSASLKNSQTTKTVKAKDRSGLGNLINSLPVKEDNKVINNTEIKNDAPKSNQSITTLQENKIPSQLTDTIPVNAITNGIPAKDTVIIKDSLVKTKTDSIIPTIVKETSPELKKESLKQFTVFSIDAGANYSLGWSNKATKEANGFNGVLGLSIMHYLSSKWSILAGIQYNSLAHLNYSSYISSNTQYDFGFNSSHTTITPKMLYYMAIPVKLQYHFNAKNSISVGVNILHLLNTSSKVDSYMQTTFESSNHSITTKSGYMDGFTAWDIQPALAYRRKLYKAFDISAEAYYGLTDIKNNTYFGINKSETNKGLKLTLSYSFIK